MGKIIPWTEGQLEKLRALAGQKTAAEIGALVGRTSATVAYMMRRMGLSGIGPRGKQRNWAEWEIATLRLSSAKGKSAKEIAAILGVKRWQVSSKMRQLGIRKIVQRPWTTAELKELHAAVGVWTVREMVGRIGRSQGSIYHKLTELGLKLNVQSMSGCFRTWSVEQETVLREHSAMLTAAELAERVDRSVEAVKRKQKELGLTKRRSYTRNIYRKPRSVGGLRRAKPELRKKPRKKRVVIGEVMWCLTCGCPVSKTAKGIAGHRERIGCKRIWEEGA
jgi:ribosomal protein L44E